MFEGVVVVVVVVLVVVVVVVVLVVVDVVLVVVVVVVVVVLVVVDVEVVVEVVVVTIVVEAVVDGIDNISDQMSLIRLVRAGSVSCVVLGSGDSVTRTVDDCVELAGISLSSFMKKLGKEFSISWTGVLADVGIKTSINDGINSFSVDVESENVLSKSSSTSSLPT